jgi:diguanylate cyclase (GGDEF)-like protein
VSERTHLPLDIDGLGPAAEILFDSLPFPVLWIDSDYQVRYANSTARRTYGSATGTCHELTHGFSEPCDRHGELCPKADAELEQVPVFACHAHLTGEPSVNLHKVIAVPLTAGGILECHIGFDDLISEDDLTHVFGRGFFVRIVRRELSLLHRLGAPYAFLVMDLDGFKAINDTHGHDVGDEVLRLSAATLQHDLRTSDSVGRWGGDEFLLFLPSLSAEDAVALAERKAESIRRLEIPSATGQIRLWASFGIFWSDRIYALEKAFHAADGALYSAKRAGGDRVVAAPPQT